VSGSCVAFAGICILIRFPCRNIKFRESTDSVCKSCVQ